MMAKVHWKEFLKPIKRFLWRKNTSNKRDWQWCAWHRLTAPKQFGGLGILDPIVHTSAMSAKFAMALAKEEQAWARMYFKCLKNGF